MLVVEGLTKKFGGFTAVNGISFEVKRGEIVGLIGPNGSGKSTTFNVLAGLFAPTSGTVSFDGQSVGGLPPYQICQRGLARTFQIPRPFRKLSILENATLAAYYGASQPITRGEALRRAEDALTLIDLPRDPLAKVDGLGAARVRLNEGSWHSIRATL
jgi:branched-chain amino acid transport system ATP-binding protein